jgi:general secretion pathway protein G
MWRALIRKQQLKGIKGFTLFELVIVITILLILAGISVPMYQTFMKTARDTALKDTLFKMRDAIDKYTVDKEEAPQSLEDFVMSNYLRAVPIDPITRQQDWEVELEEEPANPNGRRGIKNIYSAASGNAVNGTAYRDF